ncbi:MAG: outer membrane beta-barrel protein [Muribaculaceae bacterium]|nr:outer membrane beta-barrel protein [Muribaculaceae bacterium]
MRNWLVLILALLGVVQGRADVFNLFGDVCDTETKKEVEAGELTVWQNDSIIYDVKFDYDGYFIPDVPEGDYIIEVSAFGYENFRGELSHHKDDYFPVVLKPRNTVELEGVEVVADKSMLITYTSTGEIYYLSKDAKERGNPFMALQEIPIIFSDPNNKLIKGPDGSNPLILIDGNEMNSGIAPIDSHKIESVEVITAPASKYLLRGYTCVINLKLKKVNHPYLWVELDGYGQAAAGREGGEGFFEVGSPVFGVYGHGSGIFNKSKISSTVEEATDVYVRNFSQISKGYNASGKGDVVLKWMPDESLYYSLSADYGYERKHGGTNRSGITEAVGAEEPYGSQCRFATLAQTASVSAYLHKVFSAMQDINISAGYTHGFNRKFDSDVFDLFQPGSQYANSDFRSLANGGNMDVRWQLADSHGNFYEAGVSGTLSFSKLYDLVNDAMFRDDMHTASFSLGWSRSFWGKLNCTVSPYAKYYYMKDNTCHRQYVYPGGTFGCQYRINREQSVNLRYYISEAPPSLAFLNPYNTSLDSLYIQIGNPDLKPLLKHYAFMTYSYIKNGWRCVPTLSFTCVANQIVNIGHVNEAGAYVSTYANEGRIYEVSAGISASKTIKNGRIGLELFPHWAYYKDQPEHFFIDVRADFNKYWNKWNLSANISYMSKIINKIDYATPDRPLSAQLQVNYNITPNLYVGVRFNNMFGNCHFLWETKTLNYYQHLNLRRSTNEFNAQFIVSWTMRKNIKRKPRMNNLVKSNSGNAASIER